MSKTKSNAKKKLCWNCEGRVTLKEDNCPFCGVYIGSDLDNTHHKDVEDVEDDLAPPYKLNINQDIPASPYGAKEFAEENEQAQPSEQSSSDSFKQIIVSWGLLTTGTVFTLFGLALFLFSKNGVFKLQWNASYWLFYLLAGAIVGLWGWRKLKTVEE